MNKSQFFDFIFPTLNVIFSFNPSNFHLIFRQIFPYKILNVDHRRGICLNHCEYFQRLRVAMISIRHFLFQVLQSLRLFLQNP